jgi:hypothetical protein
MKAVMTAIAIVVAMAVQGLAAEPVKIDPKLPLWGTNGTYKLLYAEPDDLIAAHKDYIVRKIDPLAPEYAFGLFLAARAEKQANLSASCADDYAVRSLISMDCGTVISRLKSQIRDRASVVVKKLLYRQGKSFVTQKDGANPMEPLLRPVLTALDAPCCDGLIAALEAIGWKVDVSGVNLLPSGDARKVAIDECERRVLFAQAPAVTDLGLLMKLLGVAQFNAFVKTYNGEAPK